MRISDWSSDVCSSDLGGSSAPPDAGSFHTSTRSDHERVCVAAQREPPLASAVRRHHAFAAHGERSTLRGDAVFPVGCRRSEEHTSELQSLMRISYAVFCLKKKIQKITLYYKTQKI